MPKPELDKCPFCGAEMSACDESPIYGQTIMHPGNCDCMFSGNMFYHKKAHKLWNSRPEEDRLKQRILELEAGRHMNNTGGKP
ncbi:MAG: hypothetical protein Q8M92_05200 [Candidatus Subteraquimicrobiales bacterium]|nr:hypothetical protein [Candidatus Subteraquimicrobiales bacterium]